MAKMSVEIEGSAEEVVRVIQQLGGAVQRPAEGDAGGPMGTLAAGTPMSEAADEAFAGEWMEPPAGEFPAGLEPAANSPPQSYFVDTDFVAAAESWVFDERMAQRLAGGTGRP